MNNLIFNKLIYCLLSGAICLALFPSAVLASSCGPLGTPDLTPPRVEGLSGTWAQELIGSDLARKIVSEDILASPVPFYTLEEVDLAGVESRYLSSELARLKPKGEQSQEERPQGWHGTRVVNMVAHENYGAGGKAYLAGFATSYGSSAVKEIVEKAEAQGVKLICNSMGYDLDANATKALVKFQNGGGILVHSAGNGFAYFPRAKTYPGLYVGNLSPLGLIGGDSETRDIDIVAPGDLTRTADRRQVSTLSQTSAAQPLVCGVVANILSDQPNKI